MERTRWRIQALEFIKFNLVGALVVGTDYGVYYVLQGVMPSAVAKTISFTCGGVVGYILNKLWTFKTTERSVWELVKFAIVNVAGLGFNVGVNALLLRLTRGNVTVAFAVAASSTGIAIYLGQKFWVFRKKTEAPTKRVPRGPRPATRPAAVHTPL